MPLSSFDQTDPLRALAINDRTIKQSPAIGPLCGYNCSSSWYRTAMLESKRPIKKDKELTSFKSAISFVCLMTVRLLLSHMAVLYHVNDQLQRVYYVS